MPATLTSGPVVDAAGVTLSLPDPHGRLRGVRLVQDVRIPGEALHFTYRRRAWTLRVHRPAVDRMEYLLELEHRGGGRETIQDPGNAHQAPGAFGAKSVVEFPGYHRPDWLDGPELSAEWTDIAVRSRALEATVRGRLWCPEGLAADAPAPLIVVHDGPEFDELAQVTRWAGAQIVAGVLPPLRVALLAPGDRNRWYAVHPAYARAVSGEVLTGLGVPTTVTVGVGASLGALALLHAHRRAPGTFDGLLLQSGSFFTPEHDEHESRFARYRPIVRFVRDVHQAVTDAHPIPVTLTCGSIEENIGNNRLMTTALRGLGYDAELHEVPDVHNFTAWRDALHPHLSDLVTRVLRR